MKKKKWLLGLTAAWIGVLSVGGSVQAENSIRYPWSEEYLSEMEWLDPAAGNWSRLWENMGPGQTEEAKSRKPHVILQRELPVEERERIEEVSSLIFVGDSRVVGMAGVGGFRYVGEVGQGYYWLSGEGLRWLEQQMAEDPDAAVVFCMGINDLGNIDAYVNYYSMLLSWYPEKEFYFMSVNPVNEAAERVNGYSVTNAAIEAFNSRLMEQFPDRYIDVYEYLLANGYGTVDGVHYDEATYSWIQQYALLMVNMLRNFG